MDFMSDVLFDGRPFRLLTVVDRHTRKSLAIVPRVNFKGFQVVEVLERLAGERGRPKTVRCDNELILSRFAHGHDEGKATLRRS